MSNIQSIVRQIKRVERSLKQPAITATTPAGKVRIDTKDLIIYFIDAIKLGDIPRDNSLYPTFRDAKEDRNQGQIFECLRKLAQKIEPSIADGDLLLPRGKQAKSILESNKRLNLWYGSVRSSKTIMSLIKWLWRCATGPVGRRMMVGNTLETLELNCIEPLQDLLPAAIRFTHGWRHCFIFGKKVVLRGADDVGQEKRFKGSTLIDAYCDEVTTWAKAVWKMLLTRLSRPNAMLFGTTNPDQPLHWLNVDVIERAKDLSITLWHFVLDDNPGLDEAYKADLVRENPPGTVYYLRFILGLWVAAEGRVYNFLTDNPDDGFVVNELPKDLTTWLISIDYGQQHPTCMGLWGYSISTRCWYLVKEHYTNAKTNAVYSEEFEREMLNYDDKIIIPQSIEIDPGGGGASLVTQLVQDFPHLSINAAKKVDLVNEIQAYATAIYSHKVRFSTNCKRTIAEHLAYLWNDKARQRGIEVPIKLNDDGPDMGRYFWNRAQAYM